MAKQSRWSQGAISCTHAFVLGIMLFGSQMIQAQNNTCMQSLPPSPKNLTTPFKQPLPIPSKINISTGVPLTLGAYIISQSVHPDLPNTTLFGYGTSQATATYPGPTLEAKRGVASNVSFRNHITDAHIFPYAVDTKLHIAITKNIYNTDFRRVPIVTHLHGGETESIYDGHPEAWHTAFHDSPLDKGPTFVTMNNTYPNEQPATMLWYHDHAIGWTRLNVAAGLAGLYFIRGGSEEPAHLPQGEYEVPLVIQDRQFFANGSIAFPIVGRNASSTGQWCTNYIGDTILVNGKVWPYLNVTGNIYRFRILNGANARVLTLAFNDSRVSFLQIGTDGGYLWNATQLTNLTISPASRVDVLVNFTDVAVADQIVKVQLKNLYTYQDYANVTEVMQFNVAPVNQTVPRTNLNLTNLNLTGPPQLAWLLDRAQKDNVTRNMTLDLQVTPFTFSLNNMSWTDNVTETPRLGTVEIWNIFHMIPEGVHPVHIHLVNFLVLNETTFNLTRYKNDSCTFATTFGDPDSCYTQEPQPPDAVQMGWKDTVLVRAGTVLKLLVPIFPRDNGSPPFTDTTTPPPYPFDATTLPGYVWHCHLVDHEDNDMMRPLQFLN